MTNFLRFTFARKKETITMLIKTDNIEGIRKTDEGTAQILFYSLRLKLLGTSWSIMTLTTLESFEEIESRLNGDVL